MELGGLVSFGLLVIADTFAHLTSNKKRERVYAGAGLVLFALAVLIELTAYPYGRRSDLLSQEQIQQDELRIAKLNKDAKQAEADFESYNQTLATLQLKTAKADERAAKAKREAESERLARLKLEAQVAPRRLTNAEAHAIVLSCHRFAGRRVAVASYALDPESAVLGWQIIATLRKAGMIVSDHRMSRVVAGGMMVGIDVTGSSTEMVDGLSKILATAGRLMVVHPNSPMPGSVGFGVGNSSPPGTVTVFVGVKPPPDYRVSR